MIFRQLNFDGCLSYIIACSREGAGAIIDPSHDIGVYLDFVREKGISIAYVMDTHTHVDHVSLAPELADALGAKTVMFETAPEQRAIGGTATDLFGIEKIIAENGAKRIDILLKAGEEVAVGDLSLKALHTPGHTRDSMCLLAGDRMFTGDTLIIGQCGRTDLPGGSARDMYESLFGTIMGLSDDLIVYPAHDYNGNINSSLGYERRNNVCLKTARSLPEFEEFLKGLFPPLDAHGGKLQCGLAKAAEQMATGDLNPLMHSFCVSMEQYLSTPHESTIITAQELLRRLGKGDRVLLLDVREPEELSTRGFVKGSLNIPVAQVPRRIGELPKDLNYPIVTVCESGARSSHAALYLRAYGYNEVKNLEYGMRGWRMEGYPLTYIS